MKKWEYRTEVVRMKIDFGGDLKSPKDIFGEVLEELGNEGFELVTAFAPAEYVTAAAPVGRRVILIFKRPLT